MIIESISPYLIIISIILYYTNNNTNTYETGCSRVLALKGSNSAVAVNASTSLSLVTLYL